MVGGRTLAYPFEAELACDIIWLECSVELQLVGVL